MPINRAFHIFKAIPLHVGTHRPRQRERARSRYPRGQMPLLPAGGDA